MYLAIDIGGTKTLVACFNKFGEIEEQYRFLTPTDYRLFIKKLAQSVADLSTKSFICTAVALPGVVDREHGIGVACGNLPWKNIPIVSDIKRFTNAPVVLENDANLGGLSEAVALQDTYDRVLYVTVSTGIGTSYIVDQSIDPDFADTEGGHIILEHNGRRQIWEKFASGSAIVRRFGKRAQDIDDVKTWRIIAHDLSLGIMDHIAILQPEVIVMGGSVNMYFEKYSKYLKEELARFGTPLTPIPVIRKAKRPNEAVIYGCYFLAKSVHDRSYSKTPA